MLHDIVAELALGERDGLLQEGLKHLLAPGLFFVILEILLNHPAPVGVIRQEIKLY
jgi:hypothetical protein